MSKVLKKPKFTCEHCNRSFQQFFRLTEHNDTCEIGIRYKTKNTKQGMLAHNLWCISFKNTARKKYDYDVFIRHRDYKFFMDLSEFCCHINVINPEKYMDWCIKSRIKTKLWTSENNYDSFIKHYIVHEDPVDAVIRSINYIKNYSKDNNINGYFKNISPGVFLTAIEVGRISPWVYLLYWGSADILKRMNDEQKNRINILIEPSIWSMKQRMNKDICEEIKKTLKKEIL